MLIIFLLFCSQHFFTFTDDIFQTIKCILLANLLASTVLNFIIVNLHPLLLRHPLRHLLGCDFEWVREQAIHLKINIQPYQYSFYFVNTKYKGERAVNKLKHWNKFGVPVTINKCSTDNTAGDSRAYKVTEIMLQWYC